MVQVISGATSTHRIHARNWPRRGAEGTEGGCFTRREGAGNMLKLVRLLRTCTQPEESPEERRKFYRFKNFLYKTVRINEPEMAKQSAKPRGRGSTSSEILQWIEFIVGKIATFPTTFAKAPKRERSPA